MAVHVDHVAFQCTNLEETLHFFEEVFGMTVSKTAGEAPNRQLWTKEGLQLNECAAVSDGENAFHHVAFYVDDVPATMKKAAACGAVPIKGKEDHWFTTPFGFVVELM